ncbi:MAG: nuclear transport factor 2 family protein [Planctomycetes bacterium]|nr:nuclear transport factor 2 family protein [Planctomycetota bacterium]
MRKVLIGVGAVAALGAAAYLVGELLTTERQRVERVVRRLGRRLEARDPAGFCQLLAEDYSDGNGFNRLSLRAFLTRGLPQLARVGVRLEALEVEVSGDAARAEFSGHVTAEGREGSQPPWRHQSLVRLRLRKAEGSWRVQHAEYSLPPIVKREGF